MIYSLAIQIEEHKYVLIYVEMTQKEAWGNRIGIYSHAEWRRNAIRWKTIVGINIDEEPQNWAH